MKTKLSITSGHNADLTASNLFGMPDMIVQALEDLDIERSAEEMAQEAMSDWEVKWLINRAQNFILRRNFGKYLPKGADTIIAASRTEMELHALERGYPLTPDDEIAVTAWNAQRILDLEKWKAEQVKIRRANQFYLKENTVKAVENGKKAWANARVFELPPLLQSTGKSLKHVDARYATRLPDGRYIDLGQTAQGPEGQLFRPILSDGPDIAMQRIAKRLGLDIRGGAHTILQALTGYKDIIPAYTTIWQREQWFVIVGWQRDPKLTPSSYWIEDSQLTRRNPNWRTQKDGTRILLDPSHGEYEPALTLSELDYHLLKGSAETAVEDEEGNVVDYMNEEEELVEGAFDMEDWRNVVDISRFDEDEAELYAYLSTRMDMSEFTAGSIGLLESPEWISRTIDKKTGRVVKEKRHDGTVEQLLIGELVPTEKGTQWEGGLLGAERVLRSLEYVFTQSPSPELELKLKGAREQVERFRRMIRARNRLLLNNDTTSFIISQDPGHWTMRGTEKHEALKEPVRTTFAMTVSPANKVDDGLDRLTYVSDGEGGKMLDLVSTHRNVETMPEHRVSIMHRVKRSTVAVVGFDPSAGMPVRKFIKPLPQRPLDAKNASPALKATLRRIRMQEMETVDHNKEVADEFDRAFTAALRMAVA